MDIEEKKLKYLMNRITDRRYVNLHSNGKPFESQIISKLIKSISDRDYPKYCLAVNIKDIQCTGEEEKIRRLKDFFNEEMAKKQFPHWIHEAKNIEDLLHRLNERLNDPALIIFYQFTSPEDEQEKDLLRSIRKFIQMHESKLLGLLLISSQELNKWDLSPYSNLDDRSIEFSHINN